MTSVLCFPAGEPFEGCFGEFDADFGAGAQFAVGVQVPAESVAQPADDGQAQAVAFVAREIKRPRMKGFETIDQGRIRQCRQPCP